MPRAASSDMSRSSLNDESPRPWSADAGGETCAGAGGLDVCASAGAPLLATPVTIIASATARLTGAAGSRADREARAAGPHRPTDAGRRPG